MAAKKGISLAAMSKRISAIDDTLMVMHGQIAVLLEEAAKNNRLRCKEGRMNAMFEEMAKMKASQRQGKAE